MMMTELSYIAKYDKAGLEPTRNIQDIYKGKSKAGGGWGGWKLFYNAFCKIIIWII